MVVAMLSDKPMTAAAGSDYYTVARLRSLLPLYPVLGFSRPPKDEDVKVKVRRVIGDAPWSEASAKAADIERAVRWLNDRDWRAAYTIRATLIVGLTERDVQSYFRRMDVHVHHSTVHDWKRSGLELMSAYLCGRVK